MGEEELEELEELFECVLQDNHPRHCHNCKCQ
jgi:hypothetical protein